MTLPGRPPPGGQTDDAPGAEGAPGATHRVGGTRWLLVAALLFLLAAGLLIYLGLPSRQTSTNSSNFAELYIEPVKSGQPIAVILEVTLDSVDATTGSAQIGVVATPGPDLPPEGAVVFTDLRTTVPAIVVRPAQLNPKVSASVPFARGNIADYPFDDYSVSVALLVLRGTETTIPSHHGARQLLPYQVLASSDLAGFTATGSYHAAPPVTDQARGVQVLDLDLQRTFSTRGWVVAMMAIYWALALACAAVTVAIIIRRRPFDPRLLAFLGAMLFALIAFRNAAPGNPPIGTFLDFYALFESVGIVAISLLALMITYLARTREGLDLI